MKDCDNLNRAASAALAEGAAVLATTALARPSGRFLKGKIGRLPHALRQALNERLRDGQPSDQILPWLNSLPEARQAMEKHFGGSPMTEQNLSQWRHGGHAFFLANEQARQDIAFMEGACRGIDQSQRDALTGQIALLVTARMAVELRKFQEMPEGPAKSEAWEKLVRILALLRRGEFFAVKMLVERAKLAALQEAEEAERPPLCKEEELERHRRMMGFGGPNWNNFTKQWEGEGAAEMTEKQEVERMVVAEMLRRKEARKQEAAGIMQAEAAGGDLGGAGPLALPKLCDGRSPGAATPELAVCPENPGHSEPAQISPSEAGRAPSPSAAAPELPACLENPGHPEPAQISPSVARRAPSTPGQPPNFIRDARNPAPSPLTAFRHPRTGAIRYKLAPNDSGTTPAPKP
jgi:hypothetical protein